MSITSDLYMRFNRQEWAALRNAVPMVLTGSDLLLLQGIDEDISLSEVRDIYLPLSRLINYYISAKLNRQTVLADFLGKIHRVPYIIGIAGSVAVGKSTTARVMQALLSRWPEHRRVSLVTTDGFLYSNRELTEQGLMHRKGFPQSYNIKKLLRFMMDIKSEQSIAEAPVYSHLIYDILVDERMIIDSPDILILEGLNVLQDTTSSEQSESQIFVSDYIDFSIFVDANVNLLRQWYVNRFLKLRASSFNDPNSYFHHYSKLSEQEAVEIADKIWLEVNQPNLIENILPTRQRANLILTKGFGHQVEEVHLQK